MNSLVRITERLLPSDPTDGRIGSIDMNVWLAQLSGLPLTGLRMETNRQKRWIRLCGVPVQILLTIYVCLEIYDAAFNWGDLDAMIQNLVMTIQHLAYWYKLYNFYYHLKDIELIIKKLRVITKTNVISEKQKRSFFQSEVQNRIVLLVYFGMVAGSVGMVILLVLIAPEKLAGKSFPYRAKMPAWLPPIIQYLYMGLGVAFISLEVVGVDNINILLMNQIRLHLKILNLAFEELSTTIKTNQSTNAWVAANIIYHNDLITLRRQVDKVFGIPVMMQFVSSLLIVAMAGFEALIGDFSISILLIYFHLSCHMCELFLYCWFGNEVSEQSKTLSTSVFGSNWYEFDEGFKRSLLIFMVNAERPFVFKAGGLIDLSLETFTEILRKSYSAFAVISQMYAK